MTTLGKQRRWQPDSRGFGLNIDNQAYDPRDRQNPFAFGLRVEGVALPHETCREQVRPTREESGSKRKEVKEVQKQVEEPKEVEASVAEKNMDAEVESAPEEKPEQPIAAESEEAPQPQASEETESNDKAPEPERAVEAIDPTDGIQAAGPVQVRLMAAPDDLEPISFEQMNETLQVTARRMGWTSLMEVQSRAMPYLLSDRDSMVQSKTGSGKTGAFLLPILGRLTPGSKGCEALILVPTRELAVQVSQEASELSQGTGIETVAVYGGVGYGPQLEAFRRGCQLVIGTPGRILDHILNRNLSLDKLKVLVFDEADRMMSMGFYPDMVKLKRYLPDERSSHMFSATFPAQVRRLANQFLNEPAFLNLSQDNINVSEITQNTYKVPSMEKDRALIRLIEFENPDSAIIFCNTRMRVNYIATVLKRFGYDADQISSDLTQGAREKVLGRVYRKELRFLVATDVAARGIDIENLSHVFQYEVPDELEAFVHRSGRTGRAGADGVAITLYDLLERARLEAIGRQYKLDFQEKTLPSEEDVARLVAERVTALLEARMRELPEDAREQLERYTPLTEKLAGDEQGVRALTMLIDAYYQESLHATSETLQIKRTAEHDLPDDDEAEALLDAMNGALGKLDRLKQERMQRFVPLVDQLLESPIERRLLDLLIDDFYLMQIGQPSKESGEKPASKSKRRTTTRRKTSRRR